MLLERREEPNRIQNNQYHSEEQGGRYLHPQRNLQFFFQEINCLSMLKSPRIMKIQNITPESQDIFFTLDFFFLYTEGYARK